VRLLALHARITTPISPAALSVLGGPKRNAVRACILAVDLKERNTRGCNQLGPRCCSNPYRIEGERHLTLNLFENRRMLAVPIPLSKNFERPFLELLLSSKNPANPREGHQGQVR